MDERLMHAMLAVDEQHWWYRGRRAILAGELARLRLPVGAEVLDAGCGSGRTLLELASYGEVTGVDLSEDAAAVARRRGDFDVRIARLEQLPFDDETFDLVTCLDVIEHTPDDIVALRELRRVSKPQGQLMITVPAYQALWSRHDVANHHYRRYSRRSLRAAAQTAGWQIERMTSFNSLLLAPAAVIRLLQRNRPASGDYSTDLRLGRRGLNRLLEQPLRLEARWLAGGRTLPAGLSLLAVVRNPAVGTERHEPVAAAAACE
jgi:2-polyprenyl-3-methyl-5-hydroxy-6-metoxy-1,4-benzoquinol methylase